MLLRHFPRVGATAARAQTVVCRVVLVVPPRMESLNHMCRMLSKFLPPPKVQMVTPGTLRTLFQSER